MDKLIESQVIKCPVCKSDSFESVYAKDFNVYMDNVGLVWPTNQVVCKRCGMIYTNPQPTEKVLERYYNSYSRYGDSFKLFKFREAQVEFFKRHILSTSKTVLEIGAFDGSLLHFLRELGVDVHGIEPSEEGVKNALKNYGISLERAFFDDAYVKEFLDNGREKFDVVLFLNVFEHVSDPVGFLKLVLQITRDEGVIFIEVPDAQRPLVENVADFFSIEHIMYYTESSLKNIASVLGLEIPVIERPADTHIIRVLFKKTGHKEKKLTFINEFEKNKKVIEDYKDRRNKFINGLKAKVDGIENIIIYGAGMHTSQVLGEGLLDNINVEGIVDSDPKKWGGNLWGYIIKSPDFLKQTNTPVLISSYPAQEEISSFLIQKYPHIKQIKLY